MSPHDNLEHSLRRVEQDTDLLGVRYDEFFAALHAKDWVAAHDARIRVVALTSSVLNSVLMSHVLINASESEVPNG